MDRKYVYAAIVVVIVIVAAALFFSGTPNSSGSALAAYDNQPAAASVLSLLHVAASVSNAVGQGLVLTKELPQQVNGTTLSLNGKPEILYIGADYCPYCALERWGLIIALMRFGNFTGLQYMTSSAVDSYANTPTFTFSNASYSSSYVSFVAIEEYTNKINASTNYYRVLQVPTANESALANKYDTSGGIPFIDFANRGIQQGASYSDPTVLDSMNWSQIAGQLDNTSGVQSEVVVGTADVLTAQICMITNNTPASVCGETYVKNIESELS